MKPGLKKTVLKNHIVSEYDLQALSKDGEANANIEDIKKFSIQGQKMSEIGASSGIGKENKKIRKADASTQTIYDFAEITKKLMLSKDPTWQDRMILLSDSNKVDKKVPDIEIPNAADLYTRSRSYSAPDLYFDLEQSHADHGILIEDQILNMQSPNSNQINDERRKKLNRLLDIRERVVELKIPGMRVTDKVLSKETQCNSFETDLETILEDTKADDEVSWCWDNV